MKAIITDLDKTLLHTDKTLSAYTVAILQKCRDQDIAVMAATARPQRSMQDYDDLLHFQAITTMNGARIILPDRILENGIAHASAKQILSQIITIPDVLISLETADGLFANAEIPKWNAKFFPDFPSLPSHNTLYKILISSKKDIPFEKIGNALTDDTYYTVADGHLVQIMSKKATKWSGIQSMLQFFGISPDDAVYFGDDQDDIQPIQMCGTGVAVSNAIPAVTRAADNITSSNDQDGVARYIEEHIL